MTHATGRPLRFLTVVVGGWAFVRIAWLWPSPVAVASPTPRLAASPERTRPTPAGPIAIASLRSSAPPQRTAVAAAMPPTTPRMPRRKATPATLPSSPLASEPTPIGLALDASVPVGAAIQPAPLARFAIPAIAPRSRWSASSWAIARSGSGTPFAPQLGGSQAGARVVYALGDGAHVGIAARVSSALATRQNEAAIGLALRAAAPVTLFAERRIGLGGIRGGYAAGAIAGIGPTPVAAGFDLEAYGQAGAISRDRIEGFGDGAVRLTRGVATLGHAQIALGAGVWGGAQRGVARLDIGPSLSVALPAAGRSMRLTLDWRQRIAGNATPPSGPALSIGTDF